ncbi:MAG TPA: GNAT family N-acetyltransferase [Desulfurivibrionaceae bacterium]|nr:GNAT family N-acetyltransferase [Desulfurivibrionaceae bacterium]
MITIRKATESDRAGLLSLVAAQDNFTVLEREVAEEVIDDGLTGKDDYEILVGVEAAGEVIGFICFGPIPLTEFSFDLYWIATLPSHGRQGLGGRLLAAMEEQLRLAGAVVYIDTSSTPGYDKARSFYEKHGYLVAARLQDFYHPGDDRVIYRKEMQ